ncbi:hypothetical protein SK128_023698 [Halocaridina rubra]|uniref:Uncharacterized protein n=1 Tax=Halocaridina rubra TaxID=373956 RepID=A0AAN9AAL6_HALRR
MKMANDFAAADKNNLNQNGSSCSRNCWKIKHQLFHVHFEEQSEKNVEVMKHQNKFIRGSEKAVSQGKALSPNTVLLLRSAKYVRGRVRELQGAEL